MLLVDNSKCTCNFLCHEGQGIVYNNFSTFNDFVTVFGTIIVDHHFILCELPSIKFHQTLFGMKYLH